MFPCFGDVFAESKPAPMRILESFRTEYNPARTPKPDLEEPFWQLDLLKDFIDRSVDGIVAFDLQLRCILWNQAMEALSGIPAAQAIGQSIFTMLLSPGESRGRESVFAALLGRTVTLENELLVNASIRLDCHCSPLTNSVGSVHGGIVIVRPSLQLCQSKQSLDLSLAPLAFDISLLDHLR
jgi:PAS domain S-box-containing protein